MRKTWSATRIPIVGRVTDGPKGSISSISTPIPSTPVTGQSLLTTRSSVVTVGDKSSVPSARTTDEGRLLGPRIEPFSSAQGGASESPSQNDTTISGGYETKPTTVSIERYDRISETRTLWSTGKKSNCPRQMTHRRIVNRMLRKAVTSQSE